MKAFSMTIDGEAVATGETFGVINPATGEVFAYSPECKREHLDLAVEAANRAFASWKLNEAIRRKALKACSAILRANSDELAEIFTLEQGRPFQTTKEEIEGSAWWIDEVADTEIPFDLLEDSGSRRVEVRRKPLGVVGVITPWNYPVFLAMIKLAPALLVGNTMVLKPSPYTPLTTLRIGELLRDVLPAGVLNVVAGGDELGAWMTEHPGINMIAFTGSVATGQKVAQATGIGLKRRVLELGGNDAAIILPDVTPKDIAREIYDEAFGACGQVCIAIKRLYVHESIFDEMVEELRRIVEKTRVGDGMEKETDMGPINNLPQLERVTELVEDARQHGAKIITGGKRMPRPGYFFEPTLVANVSEGMRLVDEEQFGPVLPIMAYSDIDDAIERANRTEYGLGGSIWTNDIELGCQLAARLECGTAWVNQHKRLAPSIPFGGAKMSGDGTQFGQWGFDELCQLQVIHLAK